MPNFDWNAYPSEGKPQPAQRAAHGPSRSPASADDGDQYPDAEEAAPPVRGGAAPSKSFNWDQYPDAKPADAPKAAPWLPYTDPPVGKKTWWGGEMKPGISLDKLAQAQGYKDARDWSDQIGRSVMMGQIAGLAAPAVAGARTAAPLAAESTAPVKFTLASRAGAGTLAGEGAVAAEAGGGAAMKEFYAGLKGVQAKGGAVPQAVQLGVKAISHRFPTVRMAMAASGGSAVTWEAVQAAMSHPQAAAALAAAAGVAGPVVGSVGSVGMGMGAGQLGMKVGEKYAASKAAGAPAKGQEDFEFRGYQNLLKHDPKGPLKNDKMIEKAFSNPKVQELLQQASDLPPGSPAMQNIYQQIKAELRQ